jgi:hypothetical protein
MIVRNIVRAVLFLTLAASQVNAQPVVYRLIDIASPSVATFSFGINDSGVVIGLIVVQGESGKETRAVRSVNDGFVIPPGLDARRRRSVSIQTAISPATSSSHRGRPTNTTQFATRTRAASRTSARAITAPRDGRSTASVKSRAGWRRVPAHTRSSPSRADSAILARWAGCLPSPRVSTMPEPSLGRLRSATERMRRSSLQPEARCAASAFR